MTAPPIDASHCQHLMQTAVNCYLSTILSTAECIAQVCPEIGAPYQNRWRRLPQRIGFDLSLQSLQASGRMFQSDLDHFTELACRYFSEGLQLVRKIGKEGDTDFGRAIQETVSYADLLEELAGSLEEAADLDAAPEMSDRLHLLSEGLRKSARQMRSQLLPSLNSLAALVRECRKALIHTEQEAIVDGSTGFVNSRGFWYELKARYDESQYCCVLVIDFTAKLESGQECSDEDFCKIAGDLGGRLGVQVRPWDCLGRVGPRRLAVIFGGSFATANDRSSQIGRSISGTYSHGISVSATVKAMEASDADSLLTVIAALDNVPVAAKPDLVATSA